MERKFSPGSIIHFQRREVVVKAYTRNGSLIQVRPVKRANGSFIEFGEPRWLDARKVDHQAIPVESPRHI
ncbi:MAG TPA: hypothetical protein VFH37_03025 [Candidatus Saccharimonadales bacterium]|nr:hypothetical protein [Candidatus Saccharimonadales bacterium]